MSVDKELQTLSKTMGLLEKVDELNGVKDTYKKSRLEIIKSEEALDKIDNAMENYTKEQIAELTLEECNNLLCLEDGDLGIKFDNEAEELKFKRGFLEYCKATHTLGIQIDKNLEELDQTIKENEDEFKSICDSVESVSLYFIEKIKEKINETEDEKQKEELTIVLKAYEDAIDFNRVYECYSKLSVKNVMRDYHYNSEDVYKKYQAYIKELGIKSEIVKFSGLEEKLLEEKYHKYPNLFLFLIIRMYAYKSTITSNINDDRIFLTQLLLNVKSVFTDKVNEEQRERMKNGMMKVLDLYL